MSPQHIHTHTSQGTKEYRMNRKSPSHPVLQPINSCPWIKYSYQFCGHPSRYILCSCVPLKHAHYTDLRLYTLCGLLLFIT